MKREFNFLNICIERNLDGRIKYVGDLFDDYELIDSIPPSKGIYIICSPTNKFQYPKGKSRIIYIGTSRNLRVRLKKHYKNYHNAMNDWRDCTTWFCSRYNYMIAFGAEVYYLKTTGNENEKYLESRALEGFYAKYYAIPVGNGAKSFRRTTK